MVCVICGNSSSVPKHHNKSYESVCSPNRRRHHSSLSRPLERVLSGPSRKKNLAFFVLRVRGGVGVGEEPGSGSRCAAPDFPCGASRVSPLPLTIPRRRQNSCKALTPIATPHSVRSLSAICWYGQRHRLSSEMNARCGSRRLVLGGSYISTSTLGVGVVVGLLSIQTCSSPSPKKDHRETAGSRKRDGQDPEKSPEVNRKCAGYFPVSGTEIGRKAGRKLRQGSESNSYPRSG